jgi:hypothetical protein
MPTLEARLERLERRVDGIEGRFNDVLEAVAGHWTVLSQDIKDKISRAARGQKPKKLDGQRPLDK